MSDSLWTEPVPVGYRRNERGDLVHARNVSVRDLDVDKMVQKIHGFGADLSEQMARYREYTMTDILELADRIVTQYGGKVGGRQGNITLTSFDGCLRVQLAQAQVVEVGPEIIAVQSIIDQCIEEWGKHSSVNLRALVEQALAPNADGQVRVSELLRLRRVQIDDAKWRQVQAAIADALRPRGRAEYIRLYRRSTPDERWQPVALSLATVGPAAAAADNPTGVLYRRLESALAHARLSGLKERAIQKLMQCARKGEPPEAMADE